MPRVWNDTLKVDDHARKYALSFLGEAFGKWMGYTKSA